MSGSSVAHHEPNGQEPGGLSPALIVAEAIGLVAEGGPEALSMRKLAKRLGVEAMSLYYHVPSKPALLTKMADAVLADVATAAAPTSALDAVESSCLALRAALARHPGVAQLAGDQLVDGWRRHPASAAVRAALERDGFDAEAARWIASSAAAFVFGSQRSGDDDATFDTGMRFFMLGLASDVL